MLKHKCPGCSRDFYCITDPKETTRGHNCRKKKKHESDCLNMCICSECIGDHPRNICKSIYHVPKTRKANFIGGTQVMQ